MNFGAELPGVPQSQVAVHTDKEQCEDDDELIDSMSEDILRHGAGDERLVATIWLPLQERLCGRFCRQGQRCKSIHDQVHPQHLHRLQGRVLWKCIGKCNSKPITSKQPEKDKVTTNQYYHLIDPLSPTCSSVNCKVIVKKKLYVSKYDHILHGLTCVIQAPVKATITATTLTVSWN